MRLIRAVLGFIILALDRLFSPTPITRDPARQKAIDAQTANFTLFHLKTCPFCVKVRREIRRLNLRIAMKEIGEDPAAAQELLAGGQLDQVPCLRIVGGGSGNAKDPHWMYESSAINAFLKDQFGT